jgi:hypothetical protein
VLALEAVLFIALPAVKAQDAGPHATAAPHLEWSDPMSGTPGGWQPLTLKKIPRQTRYTLIEEAGEPVIKAEAQASASGLIHRLETGARDYPILRWRWKIDNVLTKSDVTRKRGDDYPARVYVTFAYDPKRAGVAQRFAYETARLIHGEYPPHAGLNYIWDTRAPVGTVVPNAFTGRVRMIVVDSGPEHVGEWRVHERNIYEDYLQAFGEEPPAVSGVAIMTDTDNTGESATAYYGQISLSPR